jgi:peptidyl-prolyl cis-trans isomerase B (cyclophilin B)
MDAAITPPVTVPARGHQTMTITTNLGVITVDIDLARTPCTAASMDFLASTHVLDTVTCPVLDTTVHTLICAPRKVVGYEYPDENLPAGLPGPWYHAGDVALVNDGPGTNGGRFFLAYGDNRLGGSYPLWGHVTGGLGVLQRIGADGEDQAFADGGAGPFAGPGAGHPNARLTIQSVTVGPVH